MEKSEDRKGKEMEELHIDSETEDPVKVLAEWLRDLMEGEDDSKS